MANGENDCEEAVYSEAYEDYILDYYFTADDVRERYGSNCIQSINDRQSVIYLPVSDGTFLVNRLNYRALPDCYGLLDTAALQETGILRLRRQPFINLTGQGVLVGIIDTGINYLHPAFVYEDNSTKIVSVWNQEDRTGTPPQGILYGSEYSADDINEAIRAHQADSNNTSPIDMIIDENGHGTAIAAAAAGRELDQYDFSGAAPSAGIVVVKLKQAKKNLRNYYRISDNVDAFQENDIMLGIKYLLSIAERELRPIAICIGIGTNQGDHNGTGPLCEYLNRVGTFPGVYLCSAAGNETGRAHHFKGNVLNRDQYQDVEINIASGSYGFSLELWGMEASLFSVRIKPPIGEFTGLIQTRFNEKRSFYFLLDNTTVEVSTEIVESSSADELVFFRFISPASGIWTIRVYQESDQPGSFDLWLPMERFIESGTIFLEPDPNVTICEPGNAINVITLAGSTVTGESLYLNSSRGYTRNGRINPDLTVPAVNVYTAMGQNSVQLFGTVSGTSMAAAIAAGALAVFAEWSVVNLPTSSVSAKKYFIRGADREGLETPDRSWGWGRLDIYSTFLRLGE